MNAASELEQKLEEFRIAISKSEEEEYENSKALQNTNSILLSAEESLKRKWKGQRISYHERVYLYKQMKASENSLTEIAMENNISMGTLYKMISVLKIRIKLEKMRENTLIRCSQAYYNNFSHTFCRLCCFSCRIEPFWTWIRWFSG